MRPAHRCLLTGLALSAWFASVCLAPSNVAAQEEEAEATEEEAGSSEAEPAAAPEAATAPEAADPKTPPVWWFGAYFQGAFVPSFMLKLFLDDAPTVSNIGVGVTATHRNKDGMSFVIGLGYAGYSFLGPFRISGDPEQDTEMLDSSLALLHLRGQMLWSTDIVDNMLSFEYGVGLDVGVVLGEMRRTEAYRDQSGTFQKCSGPGIPNPLYCDIPMNLVAGSDAYDAYGAHYNVVEKRVPPVALIPMLPALALRYTPIPELAIKLDAAFGLMQFAIGLSASYGVRL
jgi:hypothetical protein